jgi:hypothetical protein
VSDWLRIYSSKNNGFLEKIKTLGYITQIL